jgi:aerobic-type carbon monoxide dehydrogenase small subunit (CoxS/CutS family)
MSLVFQLNGSDRQVNAEASAPLLYVLRNDFQLNGPKYGCGLGQCGACMVLLDSAPAYACLTPVAAVAGRSVLTVEGLGSPEKPGLIQKAFDLEQAAQCGYCTAGMVIRAHALLEKNKSPTDSEIREHMQTNLCRCGTHLRVIRAIKRAVDLRKTVGAALGPLG